MTRPDEELPDGKGVAGFLDQFLRQGGNFKDLFFQDSTKLHVDTAETSGGISPASLDHYKEKFFKGIDVNVVRRANRRSATEEIRMHFGHWRNQMIVGLTGSDPLIGALNRLTLGDLADYANQQFQRWQKEVGRALPNSFEFYAASEKADYWSTMDEVMGPAADSDKTY